MTKWEYTNLTVQDSPSPITLNELGKKGWELLTVFQNPAAIQFSTSKTMDSTTRPLPS